MQVTMLFCLMCAPLLKVATFLFLHLFVSRDSALLRNLFLLRTPGARMFLTPRVSRRKDVKYLFINISKLIVEVKYSISRRTMFPPNPHLVEEATCFPLFTL